MQANRGLPTHRRLACTVLIGCAAALRGATAALAVSAPVAPHSPTRTQVAHTPVLVTLNGFCLTTEVVHTFPVPVIVSGQAMLNAFGFDLTATSSLPEFVRWDPGRVTRGWTQVGLNLLSTNRMRIGGYDDHGYTLQGSDTLVVLWFKTTTSQGGTTLTATMFEDDLAAAPDASASVQWARPVGGPNGTIRVELATDSTADCYNTPDGTVLNVVAELAGASLAGVRGAEFRIEVDPPKPGAQLEWTLTPGLGTCVGNPIRNTYAPEDTSGARIVFADCLAPADHRVLLGTIRVRGLTGTGYLLVRRHPLRSTTIRCPFFVLCQPCPGNFANMQCPDRSDPVTSSAAINWPRPLWPPNGYVFVGPESDPSQCCYSTPAGTALAVLAAPQGYASRGITGASFRIEISPPAPGATLVWTPDPNLSSSAGNPIDNGTAAADSAGVTVRFPRCVLPSSHWIPLGRITVYGLMEPRDLYVRRNKAAGQATSCPHFLLCDACPMDLACLAPVNDSDPFIFHAVLNNAECPGPCGPVGTAPLTWGDVKQLYR